MPIYAIKAPESQTHSWWVKCECKGSGTMCQTCYECLNIWIKSCNNTVTSQRKNSRDVTYQQLSLVNLPQNIILLMEMS